MVQRKVKNVLYFSSRQFFSCPFRLSLVPTICPWVSEDGFAHMHGNSVAGCALDCV